jgi:hypothetical protein
MNIKKIIKEEMDDFGWAQDAVSYHHVLNKAFQFDPIAETWDGLELDYEDLVDYLISLGFESAYNTPSTLDGDSAEGLYAYRDRQDGKLKYVYTHSVDGEIDENYYQHILGFAKGESEDRGQELQVVDARKFVKENL